MSWWEIQELIITLVVSLAVLIPTTGLTLRFGIKPFLKDLAELRAAKQGQPIADSAAQADRLVRIERQLDDLETWVRRLAEAAEFDRQLRSGPAERWQSRRPGSSRRRLALAVDLAWG
jgi:hypothetical protein